MTPELTLQQKAAIDSIIRQNNDACKIVRAIAKLLDINLLEANKLYTTFKNEKTKQPKNL